VSTIDCWYLLRVSQAIFSWRSSSASFFSLLILRRISLSLGFNEFTERVVWDGFCLNCYEGGILIWDSVLCMYVCETYSIEGGGNNFLFFINYNEDYENQETFFN